MTRSCSSGNNEWYTPSWVVDAVRKGMGGIDLDPASCFQAQRITRATVFFTQYEDGLLWPWTEPVWGKYLAEDAYVLKYTEGCRQPLLDGRWYPPYAFSKGRLRKNAVGFTVDELRAHYREGRELGYLPLAFQGGWYDPEAAKVNAAARANREASS